MVDIHLIEIYLAGIFPGERFHYGSHHLARTTPGGIEIDDLHDFSELCHGSVLHKLIWQSHSGHLWLIVMVANELLAGSKADAFNALESWAEKYAFIEKGLSKEAMEVFAILPQAIQQQLFLERDPHGNVQVSLIESEKLFAALVGDKLKARKAAGTYTGKYATQTHFFGYEGRCAFPSNFDADYCYSLG